MHPRRDDFCGAALDALHEGLAAAGHEVECADICAEGFDPRLGVEDEPDWNHVGKTYSPAVLAEQARVSRNNALIFVFPVWWWSVPAVTKGWIDRVWNKDWAYGSAKIPLKKARLVAVASSDAPHYAKRGYDAAMQTQLVIGILNYCGIEDAGLELLHGSLAEAPIRAALLERAYQIGLEF